MKKIKVFEFVVLLAFVVVAAGITSSAEMNRNKSAPSITSIRGVISNLDADAGTFTLTTEDNEVYTVSTALIQERRAAREEKQRASEEKKEADRAALLAKYPELAEIERPSSRPAPRPDPDDLETLANGMSALVTIMGGISGHNLSAIAVREVPEHKIPEIPPRLLEIPRIIPQDAEETPETTGEQNQTPAEQTNEEQIITDDPGDTDTATSTDITIPDPEVTTDDDATTSDTSTAPETPPETTEGGVDSSASTTSE